MWLFGWLDVLWCWCLCVSALDLIYGCIWFCLTLFVELVVLHLCWVCLYLVGLVVCDFVTWLTWCLSLIDFCCLLCYVLFRVWVLLTLWGSGRAILSFYTCVLLTDCLVVYWCVCLFAFHLILGFGLLIEFVFFILVFIVIWVCFIVVTGCCVAAYFRLFGFTCLVCAYWYLCVFALHVTCFADSCWLCVTDYFDWFYTGAMFWMLVACVWFVVALWNLFCVVICGLSFGFDCEFLFVCLLLVLARLFMNNANSNVSNVIFFCFCSIIRWLVGLFWLFSYLLVALVVVVYLVCLFL